MILSLCFGNPSMNYATIMLLHYISIILSYHVQSEYLPNATQNNHIINNNKNTNNNIINNNNNVNNNDKKNIPNPTLALTRALCGQIRPLALTRTLYDQIRP